MSSFFSHLNPTPSFPSYTGPYKVGTTDVEIPTANLQSPSTTPDTSITTVSFRIFYPCEPSVKNPQHINWLPDPQRDYLAAYARFCGASSRLSSFISYIPFARILCYISIPAFRNARLLPAPTRSQRWPVMVFSHGLGGTMNAYSHLLGSLSSHGMVVIAANHRDGSAPISFIRNMEGSSRRAIEYQNIPHKPSREVDESRDQQLKIRLWELGLIHEALLDIDKGKTLPNLAAENSKPVADQNLAMFSSTLDVHTPGSISWCGHSFGAATMVQFVKSVFYRPSPPPSSYTPLFTPSETSSVVRQITPNSPITLLDLWCLPLRSGSTEWLWEKPLPSYSPSGPGGSNILAILSEAFFKWRGNLIILKRVVSDDPTLEKPPLPSNHAPPHIFYPIASAHLSQSDFSMLFPWVTKKFAKADEPERTLRLNVRAILEVLRGNGVEVAETSDVDMEVEKMRKDSVKENGHINGHSNGHTKPQPTKTHPSASTTQDHNILSTDGSVRGWVALQLNTKNTDNEEATNERTDENADPIEAVMEGEVGGGEEKRRL